MTNDRRHPIKITRDLVLFTVGLAGVVWQTLAESVDRPYLLAIYAGMMGLPIFLRLDAKEAMQKSDSDQER